MTKFEEIKSRAKRCAPAIATGAVFGAAVGAIIVHQRYNPKDKIAIQFPKGMLERMRDTGKGVALDCDEFWLTIKYHDARP